MSAVDNDIVVPASFRREPRWWNDSTAWLDGLPQLVREQCERWSLTVDGPVHHGSNALVVEVRRGQTPYALRLAPPEEDLEAMLIALNFWAGHDTVEVAETDLDRRALLLERLDANQHADDLPTDDAFAMLGRLVAHLAIPCDLAVPDTRDLVQERLPQLTSDLAPLARTAGETLLAQPSSGLAVNGDLHGAQLLRSLDGTRWRLVDPLLLRGDPAYDLARAIWSRVDELDGPAEIRRGLEILTEHAGLDPVRTRAWAIYRCVDYYEWGVAHGLTIDPPRCRRILDSLS